MSTSFTIFAGTSEIQRMIIGRAVTGPDARWVSTAETYRVGEGLAGMPGGAAA
jgi:hypothetical protein